MNKDIYILLGSNLGDRKSILTKASEKIRQKAGKIIASSALYETAAWGITDQPAFINQVLHIETALSPKELLVVCNDIENELGRVRKVKWGARIIDIDILYYEKVIMDTKVLTIPHPFLQERRFTMEPLSEVAPDFTHPVFRKTNKDLLNECPDKLEVNKLDN